MIAAKRTGPTERGRMAGPPEGYGERIVADIAEERISPMARSTLMDADHRGP
jgi:hypothetical protein